MRNNKLGLFERILDQKSILETVQRIPRDDINQRVEVGTGTR